MKRETVITSVSALDVICLCFFFFHEDIFSIPTKCNSQSDIHFTLEDLGMGAENITIEILH